MKRPVVMGLLLSAVLVVEARAQSMVSAGQPARPQSPASGQTQLTVTGCLQSGNSSGATSRATGAGGGFVLANVETIDPKRDGSAAASGAADPNTGARPKVTSFRLEGNQAELQKYRNSTVEVSGTLAAAKSSNATGSATAGATGQAGPTGSGAAATGTAPESRDVPTLRVTSMRQVSPTCTGR